MRDAGTESSLAVFGQELPSRRNVETTMTYTHVLKNLRDAPRSPLDAL